MRDRVVQAAAKAVGIFQEVVIRDTLIVRPMQRLVDNPARFLSMS